MNEYTVLLTVLDVIGVLLVILGGAGLILLMWYQGTHKDAPPIIPNPINKIDHSKEVMDFIQSIVSIQAKLKFNTFKDGHDMSKITKANIEHLVADVSHSVEEILDEEKLDLSNVVFTRAFYISYIVDTSMYAIKQLLEKSMDDYIGEGE